MYTSKKRKAPEKCSFGDDLIDECHKNKFGDELVNFLDFTDQDQITYKWRAGILISDTSMKTICHYHEYKFGDDGFKKQFNKCCNVYNTHKKKVKGGHTVSLELATNLQNDGFNITPGWQLCHACFGKATTKSDGSEEISLSQDVFATFEEEINKSKEKEKLDESLGIIGISPIKTHSLAKTTRISGALTKLEKGFEKQKEIVANIFDVDKSDLSTNAETIQKADDLDRLLDLMKKNFQIKL